LATGYIGNSWGTVGGFSFDGTTVTIEGTGYNISTTNARKKLLETVNSELNSKISQLDKLLTTCKSEAFRILMKYWVFDKPKDADTKAKHYNDLSSKELTKLLPAFWQDTEDKIKKCDITDEKEIKTSLGISKEVKDLTAEEKDFITKIADQLNELEKDDKFKDIFTEDSFKAFQILFKKLSEDIKKTTTPPTPAPTPDPKAAPTPVVKTSTTPTRGVSPEPKRSNTIEEHNKQVQAGKKKILMRPRG